MLRRVFTAATVVALLSLAADARAQATGTPNHPPPDAPALQPLQPLQPTQPQGAPAQPLQVVVQPGIGGPPPAPGMARLHFKTPRGREGARVFVRTVQGSYAFICESPCTADLPPGAELRVMLGDSEESHIFNVTGDLGNEVDVEVRAASKGGLVGGIIMVSIGGIFALAGIVLTAASTGRSSSSDGTLTGGLVCLGLGVGLGLPGILLITGRSTEPRVRESPHRDRGVRYNRNESVLGDVGESRHRDPVTTPVAVTPLQLGFTF